MVTPLNRSIRDTEYGATRNTNHCSYNILLPTFFVTEGLSQSLGGPVRAFIGAVNNHALRDVYQKRCARSSYSLNAATVCKTRRSYG